MPLFLKDENEKIKNKVLVRKITTQTNPSGFVDPAYNSFKKEIMPAIPIMINSGKRIQIGNKTIPKNKVKLSKNKAKEITANLTIPPINLEREFIIIF